MTETEFVARSRPPMWTVYVLIPSAALLGWFGFAALAPDFNIEGRGAFLNHVPPAMRAAFIFGIALLCLLLALMGSWRRLRPRVEVEAGPEGIASHLFWGKGRLRWSEISALEQDRHWLFVRGTENGRHKKLIINTAGIDAPVERLYALIARYRPDLIGRQQA